ncbi:sigma-70 family RNA polymerase sigma factor [Pseudoduganella ginsengisoli]|uniref:Sigma-70 family RNA polymerase sigma factor n=1 Tax=Pseudoduganella ginsengisoli TaxID=1462440 RepID=A0A6L6Q7I6_9BURK|nr:sigma-70 family RNA polymerase sigma factor [Pseudoduganella ginsengisoli]MTW05793.1 sigma-70 family RNA polymerase sigma factor [Pseudoduganella ginsengisoli]
MLKNWGWAGIGAGDGDARLIASISRGDRHAFQELYRAYFPRLARFLGRMTRNAPLIEEVINDTLLVVWQKAQTFDGSSKVSTWIFGIAYRQALKALRGVDEPEEFTSELPGGEELEPERAASGKQLQQGVSAALDALPLEQRMVVSLTYFHGMAYQEIADTMGCPVNTVKTRMFHARQRLKTMLSSHREEIE